MSISILRNLILGILVVIEWILRIGRRSESRSPLGGPIIANIARVVGSQWILTVIWVVFVQQLMMLMMMIPVTLESRSQDNPRSYLIVKHVQKSIVI